jgi:2-dehydro-3-deoxyphosphogluconate aldolase/(4S)-4-hydroxy-2-oxoglutarate aldolase
MTKSEIIERLLDPGIIAIIRADSPEHLVEAAGALVAGGVTTMEVTMTTPQALQVISEISTRFGGRVLVGVGSVIDAGTVDAAVSAGAEFIVTPTTKPEVIAAANRLEKPIASGAFTPTECLLAHESGADFVKLFPAEFHGPAYVKTLLAPLPQLRIVPTGGVTPETVGAFLAAGSVALGVGSALVSKEILRDRDWARLTENAREFIAAWKTARV